VLEELLARELKDSGFRLLQRRNDDPAVLREQGNGLAIMGRGGLHQADVLGELEVRPRFMHPIRLFVEAKHRPDTPVGIEVVRNAVGVLGDIREQYTMAHAKKHLQRFSYRYAIFSTGGFANSALDYATTHDISAIDLSGAGWSGLTGSATTAAKALINLAERAGRATFPVNDMRSVMRSSLLASDREELARRAGIFARGDETVSGELQRLARDLDVDAAGRVALVTAESSLFTVGLFADDDELGRLRDSPAELSYEHRGSEGGHWALGPSLRAGKAAMLAIPPRQEEAFFSASPSRRSKHPALRVDILTADAEPVSVAVQDPPVGDSSPSGWRKARAEHKKSSRIDSHWAPGSAKEFLERVNQRSAELHRIIQLAVARGQQGSNPAVSRNEIYEIMQYPDDRSLRGFTKPIRVVTMEMIEQGAIGGDVEWPLYAYYESGVKATEFRVPTAFWSALL